MRAQEDFRIFAFEEKFMLMQLTLQEKNDA
jgi:hypothetical protein